jgi:hypothetical protein
MYDEKDSDYTAPNTAKTALKTGTDSTGTAFAFPLVMTA